MYKNTFKPMEYGFELSSLDSLEIRKCLVDEILSSIFMLRLAHILWTYISYNNIVFDYLLDCKFSVWKLTDLKCNLQYSKYLSSYFKSWCWIYMLTNLATVYEIFHILQHHSWVDLIITGLGHLITLVMEFSLGKN